MITPLESEATPVLLGMTNEEIANEAMAMTMMCDMTANGRQQVRMILDAFTGSRERQVEVGAIMLESLLRRTCASRKVSGRYISGWASSEVARA